MRTPYEQEPQIKYYDLLDKSPEGAVQVVGSKMSEEKLGLEARNSVDELRTLCSLFEGYKQTGESVFAIKASEYLLVWAEKYNPNTTEKGVQISLDQRYFSWVFIGATECWDTLTDEGKKSAVTLAKKVLDAEEKFWLTNSNHNNRYSYSTLTRIAGYRLLQEAGEEEAHMKLGKAADDFFLQVRDNVDEDGSTLDFRDRDAVHYHVFNQIAWETSRHYLQQINIPIPEDVKQKLDASLEFSMKYIKGHETHVEFVNSTHERDKEIQGAKIGKPFDLNSFVAKQLLQIVEN